MAKRTLTQLRARVTEGPPYSEEFLAGLRRDARTGAQDLYAACLRRIESPAAHWKAERQSFALERAAKQEGFSRVAGVDEAGRGPLAGPIVAAAVVLEHPVPALNDSKQLSAQQRESLFKALQEGPHAIGVAVVSPGEIDQIGIQPANYAAMTRAVDQLAPAAEYLLVDGFEIRGCRVPQRRIVKGDCRSQSIAAASIIAKVTRDRIMAELDLQFPEYGFARHKGYGTAEHLAAIERCGPCAQHRRSFAPFSRAIETGCLFSEPDKDSHACAP